MDLTEGKVIIEDAMECNEQITVGDAVQSYMSLLMQMFEDPRTELGKIRQTFGHAYAWKLTMSLATCYAGTLLVSATCKTRKEAEEFAKKYKADELRGGENLKEENPPQSGGGNADA